MKTSMPYQNGLALIDEVFCQGHKKKPPSLTKVKRVGFAVEGVFG